MPRETDFYHFNFHTVFIRTKEFIDQYNDRQVALTDKINANHRATAELIVRLYLKQLNHQSRVLKEDTERLPGFKTHNESLAKCKGCTKRTIVNHRERLIRSGFIVREEHRGSQGIEIWINPEVLGIAKRATELVDGVMRIDSVDSFFSEEEKNFHPLVHELQEQENINSKVDNNEVPSGHRSGLPETNPPPVFSGEASGTLQEPDKNTQENVVSVSQKQLSASEQEQKVAESRQTGSRQTGSRQTGSRQTGAERIFLLSLIRQFWNYVRRMLYPDLILSEPEEREVLNLIWESVYGKLQANGTKQEWLQYQETLLKRIDMVARWLTRSSGRWIPKPHLYFHPHNERNGFARTWQWYLKQETLKIEVRNQLLLQQVKAEWYQHDADKGKFRQKTRLQLFRIQQQRLAQYRDESLMEAYQYCLQQSLHLQKLQNHAFSKNAT